LKIKIRIKNSVRDATRGDGVLTEARKNLEGRMKEVMFFFVWTPIVRVRGAGWRVGVRVLVAGWVWACRCGGMDKGACACACYFFLCLSFLFAFVWRCVSKSRKEYGTVYVLCGGGGQRAERRYVRFVSRFEW